MSQDVVRFSGGTRDGEETYVDDHLTRVLSPSPAPGLLEVYERTGPLEFTLVGEESAAGITPSLQHPHGGTPADG